MKMMDQAGMDLFNETLAQWRREGRHIGWPELQEGISAGLSSRKAYRLAQAEETPKDGKSK